MRVKTEHLPGFTIDPGGRRRHDFDHEEREDVDGATVTPNYELMACYAEALRIRSAVVLMRRALDPLLNNSDSAFAYDSVMGHIDDSLRCLALRLDSLSGNLPNPEPPKNGCRVQEGYGHPLPPAAIYGPKGAARIEELEDDLERLRRTRKILQDVIIRICTKGQQSEDENLERVLASAIRDLVGGDDDAI